jgi:hypothetical protein
VVGDPDEAGWREDADSTDADDTKAEHECQSLHEVSFALPKAGIRPTPVERRSPDSCAAIDTVCLSVRSVDSIEGGSAVSFRALLGSTLHYFGVHA